MARRLHIFVAAIAFALAGCTTPQYAVVCEGVGCETTNNIVVK